MRIFFVLIALLLGVASADRSSLEARLVAQSGGAEFHTRDGKIIKLEPPLFTGGDVLAARPAGTSVLVTLRANVAKSVKDTTSKSHGRRLAMVVDGVVESAPVIKETITGAELAITVESAEKAQQLARALAH